MTDALLLDNQVCFALHAATRAMVGAYQPLLDELGVTYPQYLVLLVLWEEDGARVSRLGERLHLDSGTLTPLLKRLERQGLVERRRTPEDERVVEIHLTSEGKRRKRLASKIPKAIACKAALPEGDLARLRATLKQLTEKLREPRKEAQS